MTKAEFLAELKAAGLQWHKTKPSGLLRCRRGACPINAVMYARDKTHVQRESFVTAADRLGLPEMLARNIASAADNSSKGQAVKSLRRSLLRACGLSK